MMVEDGTILQNAQLDCRLLEGEVVVAHIKRESEDWWMVPAPLSPTRSNSRSTRLAPHARTTGKHVLQAAWVVLKVALYADDEAEAARRQLQRLNDPTAHAVEEVGAGNGVGW